MELITKTPESLTGVRYCIEGGTEKELEEIEARLPVLEQEIQELDVQLSDTSDYAQLKVLSERREAAECELESKTERWMELSEKQS